MLFLRWQAHSPCLYLSGDCFREKSLFLWFLNKYREAFKEHYEKYHQIFSADGIVQSQSVMGLIKHFLESVGKMYLFVDASSVAAGCDIQKLSHVMGMYGSKLAKIFLVSSGFASAQMNILLDRVDRECCYKIQDLVDRSFCKVLVDGFRSKAVHRML